ncbi:MAG: hypothetical protein ACTSV1_06155, partial [Alphaproteobacteria bacterium]
IDLSTGGCDLLVIRVGLDVEVRILKPGVHALLAALMDGADLTRAHAAAVSIVEDFDFEEAMTDLIGGATFTTYGEGDS